MRIIDPENTLSNYTLIKQKYDSLTHVAPHDSETPVRRLFVPQWEINTTGKTDAGCGLPDEDSMCQSSRSGCALASHGATSGLSICFSRQQQHWLRKSITNSVGKTFCRRAAVKSHSERMEIQLGLWDGIPEGAGGLKHLFSPQRSVSVKSHTLIEGIRQASALTKGGLRKRKDHLLPLI